MAQHSLPALLVGALLMAQPATAQAVMGDQDIGSIEGAGGETMVIAGGTAASVYRTYRVFNTGSGEVSVGAGDAFVDLGPGNALDFMVSDARLQVIFRDASEIEFQLVAVTAAGR